MRAAVSEVRFTIPEHVNETAYSDLPPAYFETVRGGGSCEFINGLLSLILDPPQRRPRASLISTSLPCIQMGHR